MAHEDESRPEESAETTRETAGEHPRPSSTASSGSSGSTDRASLGHGADQHAQPAAARSGPTPSGATAGRRAGWEEANDHDDASRPPTSAEVLDQPMDDSDVRERLNRPGMARSTRILLLVLGAVVFLGAGLLIGRYTAPATGPGSVPPTLGVIEAVDTPPGGSPVVTVRAADGTLTALQTTPGTVVATPSAAGNGALRVGESQVTVTGERDQRGETIATRVDLPAR